jgi:hypothetical protein
MQLPSYKPLHGHCFCGSSNEPCWGKVEILERIPYLEEGEVDEALVCACEGHSSEYYQESTYPQDKVALCPLGN